MNKHKIFGMTLVCLFATLSHAQSPPLSYLKAKNLNAAMRQLAAKESNAKIEVTNIGKTREGREILALNMCLPRKESQQAWPINIQPRAKWKSGLLVVSGLESNSLIGSSVILGLAEKIANLEPEPLAQTLGDRMLIFIPRVDLDGSERYFGKGPAQEQLGNARAIDWDRDGRALNEDTPVDLNHDGIITQMRQRHLSGTWIDDPANKGLMRLADASKGERGVYRVFPESLDQDNDGSFGEDPNCGVRLDRNFPHGFQEHHLPSGPHAVSEPASRALADFVLARPWIETVLVYGSHDNIHTLPKAGKQQQQKSFRRRTEITQYHKEDVRLLEPIHELATESKTCAQSRVQSISGSFEDWTYFQLGLVSAAINLFDAGTPRRNSQPTTKKNGSSSQPTTKSTSTSQPSTTKSSKEKKQKGISSWKPFPHPTLGKVEIGGWIPFYRDNPEPKHIPSMVDGQFPILSLLLSRSSRITFGDVQCKQLTEGLFELKAWVINEGEHPSQTKQNTFNRFAPSDLLILEVTKESLLSGQRRHTIPSLEAKSGRKKYQWLIKGKSGDSIHLYLSPAHTSPPTKEIVLT